MVALEAVIGLRWVALALQLKVVAKTIGVTIEPELAITFVAAQNFTLQLLPFLPMLLKQYPPLLYQLSFTHPFPSKVPKLAP